MPSSLPYAPYVPWKLFRHQEMVEKIAYGQMVPPLNIQVDLEAYCPHDCSWCSYRHAGWESKGMKFLNPEWVRKPQVGRRGIGTPVEGVSSIPKEVALNLPRQMKLCDVPGLEITGGGESMVYRHIIPFLNQVANHELETVIVTNGQFLTAKHLKAMADINLAIVRFSVDAGSEKVYQTGHGELAKWDTVVSNMQKVLAIKPKSAKVGVSFIINPTNFHEIQAATEFWKSVGCDFIRFSWVYAPTMDLQLTDENVNHAKAQLKEAKKIQTPDFYVSFRDPTIYLETGNDDFSFCGYQFFNWAVGYDCLVYPCCIEKYHGKEWAWGDLRKDSLFDLIYGAKRRQFVDKFDVKNCKPCWLRDRNKAIEYMAQVKPPHETFTHENWSS